MEQQRNQDDVPRLTATTCSSSSWTRPSPPRTTRARRSASQSTDVDDDCWIDGQELSCGIHVHQDCEDDCGLDGILSDFEEYGSPRPRPSPAPYAFFADEDTLDLEWVGAADVGMCGGVSARRRARGGAGRAGGTRRR
jgi:hypothetical protein